MIEHLHPVLPKTPVLGVTHHIGRSGLSIGDPVDLQLTHAGTLRLMVPIRRRILGIYPYFRPEALGDLGPVVGRILAPALRAGAQMRVRIVDLVPEHMAGSRAPRVYVSVWADPQRLLDLQSATQDEISLPERRKME
jgi:hypothetical protein